MIDVLTSLARWKNEALVILGEWDLVWEALGRPGRIGESKAKESLDEVLELRKLVAEGIEAFRLTKEYVNVPDERGFVLLPDLPGWSHFDWTEKAKAKIAYVRANETVSTPGKSS